MAQKVQYDLQHFQYYTASSDEFGSTMVWFIDIWMKNNLLLLAYLLKGRKLCEFNI